MTLRARKFLCVMVTLVLLSSAAGVLFWGWSHRASATEAPRRMRRVETTPSPQSSQTPVVELATTDFVAVWERPLRRPLYDPPPPPKPKPPPQPRPQPIRAQLRATMLDRRDASKSMALIQLSGGREVFRKVGEMIGNEGGVDSDVEIIEIGKGSIRVRRGEEQLELTVNYLKK